jgi:replicative DNA helicase
MNTNARTLPEALEAEQAVLGALLIDGSAVDRITALRPEHFARADHRMIYQSMLDCLEEGGAIDLAVVSDRLRRNGHDEAVAYLGAVAQSTPGAGNVRRYAELVRERALERQLLAALGEAQELVRNPALPVRDKIDGAQAKIGSVTETESRDPVRIADALGAYREELKRRALGDSAALPTYLRDLDGRLNGGLRAGELVIVAGRPSMGKSALAFQIAETAARNGAPVLALSLEMSRTEVLDRIVAGETRIDLRQIRNGERAGDPNIEAALQRISKWPLIIDDTPALTVHEVRAKARATKRRHGLALVVLDYLQLMAGGEGENRNQELSVITRSLKALAKELHVPVVVLSQLNRMSEQRHDRRPMLSDLRDSGAIEQDADLVLLVHREDMYRRDAPEWRGLAEVLVRKARNGETGDVHLAWLGGATRFADFAGEWPARNGAPAHSRRQFTDD